jgi:hypothetical protein
VKWTGLRVTEEKRDLADREGGVANVSPGGVLPRVFQQLPIRRAFARETALQRSRRQRELPSHVMDPYIAPGETFINACWTSDASEPRTGLRASTSFAWASFRRCEYFCRRNIPSG